MKLYNGYGSAHSFYPASLAWVMLAVGLILGFAFGVLHVQASIEVLHIVKF